MRVNKILIFSIIACFMGASCNNKRPFKAPYYGAVGTVLGKETCNADIGKDYWLIEIASSSSVRQQYGDTTRLMRSSIST
ncbi:hypothetical protein [Pedobacter sp. B4-66]|uniref:hypothetical protein n=1 Tax=Pedobacter sp. B4-66 TaxID=2817280 RepID=UPI001BD9FBED|nr:hypothetical protein [Pedobacter sp. B4-66]